MKTVTPIRYVTPLREGGSLPAIVEADDLGTYVLKFRGAGQGVKTLVAEIIAGELGRALGLAVPDLVLMDLDPRLAGAEPDEEIQDLLKASAGLNLGMDYLPGSVGFDPMACPVDPALAARVLWFDALVGNVDRSWRNPNLLIWHGRLWLIDHGASLIFHHAWSDLATAAARPYGHARDHVLIGRSGPPAEADAALAPLVTPDLLDSVLARVPDAWLAGEAGFDGPEAVRAAYAEYLTLRVTGPRAWVDGLEETRAAHV
ncbi:MAG: aminotransferase class I and II [Streptosporangiales bacterium]|nr:aminotransferase class I and II [Streptosporangiales bacterium]